MVDNNRKGKGRIRARLRHRDTHLGAMFLAVPVSAAAPFTAWASLEFACTGEKRASLRDSVLEYDKLADLTHEYNVTVINSRIGYDGCGGKGHDDMKNTYRDMTDKLYDSSDKMMDVTDKDQPGYGSMVAGATGARPQAEQNQDMTDSQNEDDYVKKLGYDRQEASLVKKAQAKVNSYWQKFKAIPALEEAATTAFSQYQSATVKAGQGAVTQVELLPTQEKMEAVQAAIQTNGKEMDAFRRELCVMTGRSYDIRPDVREVVVSDSGKVDSIDLAADKEGTKITNYAQTANKHRLRYTGVENQYDVMERKVENGRRQIETGVKVKYKPLKQAQVDCNQTREELELVVRNTRAAECCYSLDTISRNEYLRQRDGPASR